MFDWNMKYKKNQLLLNKQWMATKQMQPVLFATAMCMQSPKGTDRSCEIPFGRSVALSGSLDAAVWC